MFKMSYLQIFFVVFFGETNFFEGQLIVTYSVVQSLLCSAHKDSPVAKTFNTLTAFPFPLFCGTKSLHHRLRLRKRFVGWL